MKIRELFAGEVDRRIEEVIKVDQTDEEIIRQEIDEYIVTGAIGNHYARILDRYSETPNKPHEGIGVWVSGFFGSGKSSFAKILGLILSNREIAGKPAADRFAERTENDKVKVLLRTISEKIRTEAVILDVSTDRGVRGNQGLTEIIYRSVLERLGYARDLDLAELEITLEEEGRLAEFTTAYRDLYDKEWSDQRGKVAFALSEASAVMNKIDPSRFSTPDSWVQAAKGKADVTPGLLATRALALMDLRRPGQTLVIVVDEVGQFVARDTQKMLELQGIVQSLGRVGRGKLWLVVTSQEKLNELVGGLDGSRVELARLMDRYPPELQVHLEQSDISEVTSRRVLAKNSAAQKTLRELFEANRGRLKDHTSVTADVKLPELSGDAFINLYPLLPYQVEFVIQVVSGLRTAGGTAKHVGGANRTIIKLAQQLLINPAVNLADEDIGALATADKIYDLVENNISSDLRKKIADIPEQVDSPIAQSVAKTICLLQFVRSIHPTAENIAALLHPSVSGDSLLPQVQKALKELEERRLVRRGDEGYRIPTPTEDDWERSRDGLNPSPGDVTRSQVEIIKSFWQPQPNHNLLDTKVFKAGLMINERAEIDGDLTVNLRITERGGEHDDAVEEMRKRSQQEDKTIFWVVPFSDEIDREAREYARSSQMIDQKERQAKTGEQQKLVAEEKRRKQRHQDELKRMIRTAILNGTVWFRGNDRSPDSTATDVGKAVARVMADSLPDVFHRFEEGAARVSTKDRDSLLTSESLHGVTSVFHDLDLIGSESGKPVIRVESGPLQEIYQKIENQEAYGQTVTGKYLAQEFEKEPFGWDFDVVRLFALTLLRAGQVEVTSKGQTIDNALSPEAKETFSNNNYFKQAAFRRRVALDFETRVKTAEAFKDVFGEEAKGLEEVPLAQEIRTALNRHEGDIERMYVLLQQHRLPGSEVLGNALEQIRSLHRGSDADAIRAFHANHATIKEATRRGAELEQSLSEPNIQVLETARTTIDRTWPKIEHEPDLDDEVRSAAESLTDRLEREDFYRELAQIENCTRTIEKEFDDRSRTAIDELKTRTEEALQTLRNRAEWANLPDEQKTLVSEPLEALAKNHDGLPVAQLRERTELVSSRERDALAKMMSIQEGERLVRLPIRNYFSGGIETQEQLDAALGAIREECESLIGAGKKILVE